MCQGWTTFVQTSAAIVSERIIELIWVTTITKRFGYRSATQPPQVAKNSIGAEAAAATMPRSAFEPVS